MYDFIDWEEFLKKRHKKNTEVYTALDSLCKDREEFQKKLLFKAWLITDGNISKMAKGLKLSRNTLLKYLRIYYGEEYQNNLKEICSKRNSTFDRYLFE